MKILVLRGGALGDFIVTLPALRALCEHWPGARVELAGNAVAAQLGLRAGWLHAAHSQHEARWAALYSAAPLPAVFAAWLDSFDRIISFWADPDGTLRRHFEHRGADFLASHPQVGSRPAARHFCEALVPWGLHCRSFELRLEVPPGELESLRERLGPPRRFIALHPGSGSAHKNWPAVRWKELCSRLPTPLLLVSGEADPPLALTGPGILQARSWPLSTLGAALRLASLYLGHDTGVSHLAASVGTPSLLLFGPTDPAIWAPPDPCVQVLRAGPALTDIAVEDVLREISRFGLGSLDQAAPA